MTVHNVCIETILPTQICTDCTGQPYVENIPPHVAIRGVFGWTAGANSVARLSDGVSATWTGKFGTSGEITGLAPSPHVLDVIHPESIRYGLYVFTINGITQVQAIVLGFPQGPQIVLTTDAALEIIRVNGAVLFNVAGDTIYQLDAFDDDEVLLGDCIYSSGDFITDYALVAQSAPISLDGAMSGLFDPLEFVGADTTDFMFGALHVSCYMTDGDAMISAFDPLTFAAIDAVDTLLALFGSPTGYFNDYTMAPDVAVLGSTFLPLELESVSYVEIDDSPGPMYFDVQFRGLDVDNWMIGNLPRMTSYMTDAPQALDVMFLFLHTAGYFKLDIGHGLLTFNAHGNLAASSSISLAMKLFARVVAKATMRSRGESLLTLTARAEVNAAIKWLLQIVCEDTADVSDTLDTTRNALAVASDVLIATDVVSTVYEGRVALAAFAILADSLTATGYMQLTDAMVADAVMSTDAKRIAELISTANLADSLDSNRLSVLVVFEDAGVLTASETIRLDALMNLDVAAFVGGRFTFDGIPYTIYSIAPSGAQVNEIEGWDYDSFFELDGKVYATSPRGLVEIDNSDTDEGEDIDATFNIATSNFGSALEKMNPAVHLGITSDGVVAVGVGTYDRKTRSKKRNWYALHNIERASPTGVRVTPSKGLHSVYMDYEIRNIEGSDFNLDFVKVYELALKRRKTS